VRRPWRFDQHLLIQPLIDDAIARTEYWCVLEGSLRITVDALDIRLAAGDLAILRQGGPRRLVAETAVRVALTRE